VDGCLLACNMRDLAHQVSTSVSQIPRSMRNFTRPTLKHRRHHADTFAELSGYPLFLLFPDLCIFFAENTQLHLVSEQAELGVSVLTHKRLDDPYRLVGPEGACMQGTGRALQSDTHRQDEEWHHSQSRVFFLFDSKVMTDVADCV
jgi:hypothetical protein